MRSVVFAVALLAACSKESPPEPSPKPTPTPTPTPPPTPTPVPPTPVPVPVDRAPSVEPVVIHDKQIRFYGSGKGGLVEVRSAAAPEPVVAHAWLGRDLAVVGLGSDDAGVAPVVGLVTKRGYEAVPVPANVAWPVKPITEKPPVFQVVATKAGELWVGRCEWDTLPDCNAFAWLRLRPPGDGKPTLTPPAAVAPPYVFMPVEPPATVKTALVDVTPPAVEVPTGPQPGSSILSCTQGGRTVRFPDSPKTAPQAFMSMGGVEWVSADPPIFRASLTTGGALAGVMRPECNKMGCTRPYTFEGCAPSKHFAESALVPGPDGSYALVAADRSIVRWRDKVLGEIVAPVTLFAFAPPP
jgi:hypothetical protein